MRGQLWREFVGVGGFSGGELLDDGLREAGEGAAVGEAVVERARTLRREYIASLRSRGIIGGRAWFTDDPPGTTPMFPDPFANLSPEEREARREWGRRESDRVHDQRQLDLSMLPRLGAEADMDDAVRDLAGGVVVVALLGVFGAVVLVACGAVGERSGQV